MLLVLFRRNGSEFVPPQHYYNCQITFRAKYVSQAVSQVEKFDTVTHRSLSESKHGTLREKKFRACGARSVKISLDV